MTENTAGALIAVIAIAYLALDLLRLGSLLHGRIKHWRLSAVVTNSRDVVYTSTTTTGGSGYFHPTWGGQVSGPSSHTTSRRQHGFFLRFENGQEKEEWASESSFPTQPGHRVETYWIALAHPHWSASLLKADGQQIVKAFSHTTGRSVYWRDRMENIGYAALPMRAKLLPFLVFPVTFMLIASTVAQTGRMPPMLGGLIAAVFVIALQIAARRYLARKAIAPLIVN